jgi:hypothetical protein
MTPVGVVARVRSGMFPSALQRLAALGAVETETEEQRLRRSTLVLSTFLVCALTPFWVATYVALGLPVPASIPLAYLVVSIALLVWFGRTKRYAPFRTVQLSLMLLLPFALQWSLGGFVASSGVSLWALSSALGALTCAGTREAVPWFVAYLALLAVSVALEPVLEPAAIPEAVRIAFFAGNLAGPSLVAYLLLQYFVRERDRAHARSERLLLNVLPSPIADRLKQREGVIADRFPEATQDHRRHRGVHPARGRPAARGRGEAPRRRLHHLRPAGRGIRPGEDQDHRRRVHVVRRAQPAAVVGADAVQSVPGHDARRRHRRWPRLHADRHVDRGELLPAQTGSAVFEATGTAEDPP